MKQRLVIMTMMLVMLSSQAIIGRRRVIILRRRIGTIMKCRKLLHLSLFGASVPLPSGLSPFLLNYQPGLAAVILETLPMTLIFVITATITTFLVKWVLHPAKSVGPESVSADSMRILLRVRYL